MRARAFLGAAAAGLLALNLSSALSASAAPNRQADPVLGPHARDEARHRNDAVHFKPAHSRPIPRQTRPNTVGAAVPPLPAGPLRVVPAPLATEGPTAAAPAVLSATHDGLNREVFGFAPYWALPVNGNWNYSLLSTLAYFGIDVNADGTFNQSGSGWSGWTSQDLVDMISRAHQAGDRVVLVIKAFDEATINQIVTTPAATQNAIDNTANAVSLKNLDGVNVDFEGYASSTYPNIQSGFTSFMTQLSTQLHKRWPTAMISVDTYSGAASWDNGLFNIGALAPVVDAFFVMAYDMNFSNLPGHAGPNAPLNGWTYNDTTSVAQYLSKAPASKIILGVPYYGYKYSTTSTQPYAASTGNATADTYSGVLTDFGCAQQLSKQWDDTAASPWATWFSPASGDPCGGNYNSNRELYYDDARSLGLKYDLVISNNLRGAGMWALGYDGTSMDLWNELSIKFAARWVRLGGSLSSAPAASSWGQGRLDVFAQGADLALYHIFWDGTAWHGWERLGGSLTSDPAAVSWGPNRIDVFARGNDLALYHMFWDGTTWHPWDRLLGSLSSAPAVASWGANRLDVFARGNDAALYHMWTSDGTTWNPWERVGGSLLSGPAAVATGPNQLHAFAAGGDLALYHTWTTDGTTWQPWQRLGGALSASPGASSWGGNRIDVFGRAGDLSLYHMWWDGISWQPWQRLGGTLSAAPAAVSQTINSVDVFARGPDMALYQMHLTFY